MEVGGNQSPQKSRDLDHEVSHSVLLDEYQIPLLSFGRGKSSIFRNTTFQQLRKPLLFHH